MASKVSIANRALTKLGADRILLLSDDTQQARVLNSMFDDVRDEEIRRNHWKFSIKRTQLPALVATPDWGYQFQYPVPQDFLGIVQINDYYVRCMRKGSAPWSLEGGNILTDLQAPLKLRYVARIDSPGLYDSLFCEALACKLAMEACEALTQSTSKRQQAAEEYKFALAEARRVDAIENPPDLLPDGGWIDARQDQGRYSRGDTWTDFPSGTGF